MTGSSYEAQASLELLMPLLSPPGPQDGRSRPLGQSSAVLRMDWVSNLELWDKPSFSATILSCCQQRTREIVRQGNLRQVCSVPQATPSLWETTYAAKTSSCGWQHGAEGQEPDVPERQGSPQLPKLPKQQPVQSGSQEGSGAREWACLVFTIESPARKVKPDQQKFLESHHRCQASVSSDMAQGAQSSIKEARLSWVKTWIGRLQRKGKHWSMRKRKIKG